MNFFTFNDLVKMAKQGEKVSFDVPITEKLHNTFAEMCNSFAPLHHNDEFAKECGYERRISYGLLSLVLAVKFEELLPGCYGVGFDWHAQFRKPIYIGDTLTFTGELGVVRRSTKTAELVLTVINQHGETVSNLTTMIKMVK